MALPLDSISIVKMKILKETQDKRPLLINPEGYPLRFVKHYLDQDLFLLSVNWVVEEHQLKQSFKKMNKNKTFRHRNP